jgi:hypothetical protein
VCIYLVLSQDLCCVLLYRLCETAIVRIFTVENVCLLLPLVDTQSAFKLRRQCIAFILDQFTAVSATKGFQELPSALLQELLTAATRRGLSIPSACRSIDQSTQSG